MNVNTLTRFQCMYQLHFSQTTAIFNINKRFSPTQRHDAQVFEGSVTQNDR